MKKLEIIGLTHKICFFDTLFEMYQVNIDHMNFFTREVYSGIGENTLRHYDWLKSVYAQFDNNEKKNFQKLFTSGVHVYHILNETVNLPDDASADNVLQALIDSETTEIRELNGLIKNIPDSYLKAYSDYFNSFRTEFDNKAKSIQKKADEHRFDILSFMEDQSGIKFSEAAEITGNTFPDTVKFYFTFRPIGAMGFQTSDEIISTLQSSINELAAIVKTPFHEFSHSLFRTFTPSEDFKKISLDLRENKNLFDFWDTKTKNHYDWDGWVEENLVEGFSKFLFMKYKELYNLPLGDIHRTYVFDDLFCNYLLEKGFDPSKNKLRDHVNEFLKSFKDPDPVYKGE